MKEDNQELFDLMSKAAFDPDNRIYTKHLRDAYRSIAFEFGLDSSCLEGMHFGDR